jgi:hypothetical protein
LLAWIGLATSRNGPISQVQDSSLSDYWALLSEEQSPTRDTANDQNARGNGEELSRPLAFEAGLKLRKISVARAAGSQMIEPLFRLGEWHFMGSDPPQNIRARAAATLRIWKLLKQAAPQRIQDASFVSLGIPLCVQTCLHL